MQKMRKDHRVLMVETQEEIKELELQGYVKVGTAPAAAPADNTPPAPPAPKPFGRMNVTEQTAEINACKTIEELTALEPNVKPTVKSVFDAKKSELEKCGQDDADATEMAKVVEELAALGLVPEENDTIDDLKQAIEDRKNELADKAENCTEDCTKCEEKLCAKHPENAGE